MIHRHFTAIAIAIGLVSALPSPPAQAARGIVHRVKAPGETYAELAKYYYGRSHLEQHLRMVNRATEPLVVDTTILIPTFRWERLRRGQSLADFAKRHLQDGRRAEYLAELHGLSVNQIKPGQKLRVVPSLRHTVRAQETLQSLARTYYRDTSARRRRLIRLFNNLPSEVISPGKSIRIPLDTPEFERTTVLQRAKQPLARRSELKPEAPLALASPASAPPRSPSRPVRRSKKPKSYVASPQQRLRRILRMYQQGDYQKCKEASHRWLRQDKSGSGPLRIEFLRLRACCLVAFEENDEAQTAFEELLKLDPNYTLDPKRTSPRILAVFEEAQNNS